ncbi:MAG: binding-protein-dependent transport system inner rane component [Acidimicrobiales bacterium]|jgi:ABC-type nitrate/sulfonate/bicarbonate transport system permease component|nr:binding-protein-dependent transport system inner rane component [Acidimicrobiales bacterium]
MTVATAAPIPVVPAARSFGRPSWLASVVGIVGFVLVWQLGATYVLDKSVGVPSPTDILHQMSHDGFSFYWRNATTTVSAAFKGWVWGNLLAIALAMLVLIAPVIEKPLIQLGVVVYCLPVVAIGPVFAIVFNGETPKVILAAMLCFFTTLIGMILGLRSADRTSLDVVHAYGGGPMDKLVKVRLRASLPSLFAALRIAAPSAILGAIIGEYLGAERGLGVTMINSQQALEVSRTWALALVATAAAGGAYGVTALIGRMLTPWAPKGQS